MSVIGWLMIGVAVLMAAVVVAPKPKLPLLFEFGMFVSLVGLFFTGESLIACGTASVGKFAVMVLGGLLMTASLLRQPIPPQRPPRALQRAEMAQVHGAKK